MTKEQQSLQELGRTPEEMAAKTAEMDRIAREGKHVPIATLGEVAAAEQKPAKKRRSDAGVPRKKPEPPTQVAGALSLEQVKHIRALQVKLVDAYENHRRSSEELDGVSEEIDLYLQSLTAQ